MEILRIGTVNLAVRDAEAAGCLFRDLGFSVPPGAPVRLDQPPAQIRYLTAPVGDSSISFVESSSPDSPVSRFLDKRGQGILSISLEVRGLPELMAQWATHKVEWVLAAPMVFDASPPGRPLGGAVNWTRPATTYGMMIEVIERHLE